MEFKNVINWFEIAVEDFNRAHRFYNQIMEYEMPTYSAHGYQMAYFPQGNGNVTGTIVHGPGRKPASGGTTIYLDASPSIDAMIQRIRTAGGQIIMDKTLINEEIGYMAVFLDTEGNQVALHSFEKAV